MQVTEEQKKGTEGEYRLAAQTRGSTYGVLYGDGIDLMNIDLYDLLVDCFRTGYINLTLG